MTKFTQWLSHKQGCEFPNYATLHEWSVDNLALFWESFLEFTDVLLRTPYDQVIDSLQMPGARWFHGATLNFAENILAREFRGTAIISQVEGQSETDGPSGSSPTTISYPQLAALVARCARGLKQAGIEKGDRVAGYLANVPEAIIGSLASACLGATWSSASPDFGLDALYDRLQQVEPKLIFATTHYRYGGKTFRTDEVVKQLHDTIPSIETIVSIPYPLGAASLVGDTTWERFLGPEEAPELTFTQVPFDHPLYILFSSGTTGPPKCIVHGTGGTLLQHRKEHQLHCDIHPQDFLLFFTTTGWMMWNWQLSALSLGATIGLFDGNPAYPDLGAIWRLVDQLAVTHFGTSGRFMQSCMKSQPPIKPGSLGELHHLRSLLYTGSALSSSGFRWVYKSVKKDIHLAGISGGTDIVSCFVLGNPNLPVNAGEIQCKGLGVDVVALDKDGRSVVSQPGELVCRKPLPSMPIEFINDLRAQKYREAYFEMYPGMWRHGDYVEFGSDGSVIIHGRSDSTLNPAGVRIGSAELYSTLDSLPNIAGAVAIGWQPPHQSDEIVVLCVVLSAGEILDEVQAINIRQAIRSKNSPRHVPHEIFQISEIPVTRSGKTVELTVKAILSGGSVSNRDALANPQVLEEFHKIRSHLVQRYAKS